ncbi:class A beta-lactamase [Chryseobacterium sp. Mn2064]|uniref:class A beta-lactamase n=1 Tax=Chryseobacterium sp. Mn2064 TaxID=3395263 RepID=UPI003BE6313A
MKNNFIFIVFTLLLSSPFFAQTKTPKELTETINSIILSKKADVGVSIVELSKKTAVQVNGEKPYPMLSTVKFPIALTILHKIEKGELSMQQKLFIKKEELLENTWSPFKEKHPGGNIEITLEDAMKWMVSYSDNNLTDILLRLIGGTEPVQKMLQSKNFIIQNNEEDMHKDWESQFINTITPKEATRQLQNFYTGKILNKEHTQWLYTAMLNNVSGTKRLKGKLPHTVKLAHRTGTSFTNETGMTGAINDFGIIELPGKRRIYIAVFVHDTFEKFEDAEGIIADIAKATYDYYNKK